MPRPPPQHMVTMACSVSRALQLVDGLGGEDGAGAAERVTERDGTAVGVHALHVALVRELPCEHDRRERLVDLDEVDVVDGEAVVVEQLLGRGDRAFEHEHRVAADEAHVDDRREGREPERDRLLAAS